MATININTVAAAILLSVVSTTSAFTTPSSNIFRMSHSPIDSERRRQSVQVMMAGGFLGGIFGGENSSNTVANAATSTGSNAKINNSGKGPTNEIIKKVNGMNQRRLGGSDIIVSELGLGTQRWVSSDFNAPNKDDIFKFMDYAILDNG
eukprot:scaffold21805_cov66-Skeletonema_marinoi.AAC.1